MKTNDSLRYSILSGLFLTPFISFVVLNDFFFPFITGKAFVFRIIIEIITLLWLLLILRDKSYAPKFSWIFIAVATFLGVMTLADIFSINPFKSFWSNFERMEGLITLFHLGAYFIVASSVLNTKKLWDRLFQTSIAASFLMGLYGLLQLAGKIVINQGGVRLDGTFGNAAYLAVYMMFHIFLTAYFLMTRKNSLGLKFFYYIAIVLQFIILYFTATRGAFLGLVGGMILAMALIILFEKERLVMKKTAIGILVGIFILIGGFFAVKNTSFVNNSPVLSRFSSISISDRTTKSRFLIWNMAWQGFQERPILGWGQESFNYVFNDHYNPGMYGQEQWFDRAHNVVFDWLIAGGALGLLSYISIFVAALYLLWRKKNDSFSIVEKSIFTGLLGGYVFNNLFIFDNLGSYILFFSVIAYIYTVSSSEEKNLSIPFVSDYVKQNIFPAVSVLVMIFMFYFLNVRPIEANLSLLGAFRAGQSDPAQSLKLFKGAISYKTLGLTEMREQLLGAVYDIAQSPKATQEIKSDFYLTGTNEMLEQIKETPKDARNYVVLGTFFSRIGRYDEALKYFIEAEKLSPNKQTILFYIGDVYINQKKYTEALEVLKEAYELEPIYTEAKIMYAVANIYAGNLKLGNSLVEELGEIATSDTRVLNAYISVGEYNKVLVLLKDAFAKDPTNLQKGVSLAAGYLQTGQMTNAVIQLQKLVDTHPEFKSQGEYFISEIRAGRNPSQQ
ncbi:MAG: O-antigen ligase family protein [Parcubacteria group bacterium]|nr:O-antigen ligase family protein [Parcubacteria group bacterium]